MESRVAENNLFAVTASDAQKRSHNTNEWNDYVIRCEGRRIQLWLNGRQPVDYTEPDKTIPQTGVIGLQIHGGPPAEAWYKDITIREPRTDE